MKFGGIHRFLFLLGLCATSVIAEEQTCSAEGDCSADEEGKASVAGACADGHDQCEYWASLGEWEKNGCTWPSFFERTNVALVN